MISVGHTAPATCDASQTELGGGASTPLSLDTRENGNKTRQPRSKRSRRKRLPRPRQQGDIDGLCGFYAVINALRLAFLPLGGLSVTYEHEIWCSIVRYADRRWRFSRLFLGGTHTYQFIEIARRAAAIAEQLSGTRVVLKSLLRKDVEATVPEVAAVVTALQSKGLHSILAGINGKETSHWTVITGVSKATLRVLDSDGFHYLKLDGCKLATRRGSKGSPRYWVRIYGAFVVTPRGTNSATAGGDRREGQPTRAKKADKSNKRCQP